MPVVSQGSSRMVRGFGAAAALCASFSASDAHAYCREVTATPPDGYDPVAQGCFTTAANTTAMLPPLFWRNQCVGFNMQKDASGQVSLSEATNVAIQAFATWSNAVCPGGGSPSITATDLTPVSCNGVPSQTHNNPIMFRDDMWPHGDRANAIGYTTLTVDLDTGEILGAAVEINSHDYSIVTSGVPSGTGVYDLASVLTHEAGHFLGLAHSADTSAVMYAYYQPESTELTPDDVAGICSIYPTDGSRNTLMGSVAATACDPRPRGGMLDACGTLDAGAGTVALSTPAGDGGGGGGGGDPSSMCITPPFGCGVVPSPASSGVRRGLPASGILAIAAILRRTLRRRKRKYNLALFVLLTTFLSTTLLGARDAQASVSIAVGFDELIAKATAAAVVRPVEQLSVWEEGRIVTYTRARVERRVAGQLDGRSVRVEAIWVRTAGGSVGRIGQIVEGEATFVVGVASLVFVAPVADTAAFAVVEGAQGQFSIASGADGLRTLPARGAGALVLPSRATALARDVLGDRSLEDAARDIASAWARASHKQ